MKINVIRKEDLKDSVIFIAFDENIDPGGTSIKNFLDRIRQKTGAEVLAFKGDFGAVTKSILDKEAQSFMDELRKVSDGL